MKLNALILEPFGGGSHLACWQGWQRHSRHELTLLDLPAVHWKWRSRHSSLTLALDSQKHINDGAEVDVIVASGMLNLPEWLGLAPATLRDLPRVVYFHENQFTYPLAPGQSRDYHFAYSNLLSALAADQIWFNSHFHRQELKDAAVEWLRRMPDFPHRQLFAAALDRSHVLPPGVDPPPEYLAPYSTRELDPARHPLTLGWVARWEHDKRPDRFIALVERLTRSNVEFRLILLGQQFTRQPPELKRLLEIAGDRVRHAGFASSGDEYWGLLSQIDIVISTADHEFFGLGIVEAILAGATPLLPNRLAYPEVLQLAQYPQRMRYLYGDDDELFAKVQQHLGQPHLARPTAALSSGATSERPALDLTHLIWSNLAQRYDQQLESLAGS